MEDPISDSKEIFEKRALAIAEKMAFAQTAEAVKQALVDGIADAYKFGLLMGAAAERAYQKRISDVDGTDSIW